MGKRTVEPSKQSSKEFLELKEAEEKYKKAQQKFYDTKRPGIAYSLHFDEDVYQMLENLRRTFDTDKKEVIQRGIRELYKRTPNILPEKRIRSEE